MSIIVAVFDSARALENALQALSEQHPGAEVVRIIDPLPDDTSPATEPTLSLGMDLGLQDDKHDLQTVLDDIGVPSEEQSFYHNTVNVGGCLAIIEAKEANDAVVALLRAFDASNVSDYR